MVDSLIFGVDIASGSPRSKQPPSYALCILDGDETVSHPMTSRYKLIRLIREARPAIVAVDNVHELASGRDALISLLRQLPPETKLVQVTGGDRPRPLAKLARWHGISFDRLNPNDEAEVCARLAFKGVGHVLSAFEDRTRIKVSRRRSPGRGGWSQKRYSRKIHGSVKREAREVEARLKEADLEYTSNAVEGIGGYIRCVFNVEAPREAVHVRQGYYGDAQVKVEGVVRPKLHYEPLRRQRGYIIVGMDPGTTTGLAALDLRGELVDRVSSRAMAPSDVVEWIASRGKPLIVATDVYPTPGSVEKVKRAFNAVLYSPGGDLPAEEKILMARRFGYKNDHERDALAAAYGAYKRYRNKFGQVVKKCPPEVDSDEIKALVVKGYSIDSAVSELTAKPEPLPPEPHSQPEEDADVALLRGQIQQQNEQVKTLREYVDELKADIRERDRSVSALEDRLARARDQAYREAKRDHEVLVKNKEIARLRGLLRSERKRVKRLKSRLARKKKAEEVEETAGFVRLKPVEAFSREEVLLAFERWSIERGDLVLLADASGGGPNTVDLLVEMGIDAVVIEGEIPDKTLEYFVERGLVAIPSKDVAIKRVGGESFVDPSEIEAAKEAWSRHVEAREARHKAEWLESIFAEYRVERMKEQKRMEREERGRKSQV